MMAGVFTWLLFFQRAGCSWGELVHRSVTLSTPCWVCQGCKAPCSFYTGCFSGLYLRWATLEDEVMSSSGTQKAGLLTACYKTGGFLEASVFSSPYDAAHYICRDSSGSFMLPSWDSRARGTNISVQMLTLLAVLWEIRPVGSETRVLCFLQAFVKQ